MTLDPSIPYRAGTAATVNLADMYAQAQQMRQNEQVMRQRQQALDQQRSAQETAAQQQQLAAKREQAGMIARLTQGVTDDPTYQQRIAAARAYGLDVSEAPSSYDPNWVQTQNILATTFFREGPERLTTTAQELVEMGLDPGTPEFQQAMAQRIALKDSKVVNTTAGGMSGMLGPNGYQPFILPNPGGMQPGSPATGGSLPRVNSIEEARRLPPGTRFIDPNGVERQVPGGGASNGAGNFPNGL